MPHLPLVGQQRPQAASLPPIHPPSYAGPQPSPPGAGPFPASGRSYPITPQSAHGVLENGYRGLGPESDGFEGELRLYLTGEEQEGTVGFM